MQEPSALEQVVNAVMQWSIENGLNITWCVFSFWICVWAGLPGLTWREKWEVMWKGGLSPLLIPLAIITCVLLFPYHLGKATAVSLASILLEALILCNLPLAAYLGYRWRQHRLFIALSLILGGIASMIALCCGTLTIFYWRGK